MTVGTIENRLTTAAPGSGITHNHAVHLIVQNVEDLVGWQVRFNYIGDQTRLSNFNATPFTDTTTGEAVGFANLPIDSSTGPPRRNSREQHPGRSSGLSNTPQTALIGAVYNGVRPYRSRRTRPPRLFPTTPATPPPAAVSSPR